MKAIWRDEVIAESDRILEVDGYRYFPRESVRMELLHGVQFYDLATDAARSERAAWSYEAPRARMKEVDHWIGFWNDVQVE